MSARHALQWFAVLALWIGAMLHAGAAAAAEPAPRPPGFVALAYRDIVDKDPEQRFGAVTTSRLAEEFDWLKKHGYQPVSLDDLIAAGRGRPLPPKPVLLTFDDGFESFYTRVFPLLQAFHYPAVLGVVGSWISAAPGATVRYGDSDVPRAKFMTWNQVRAVAASGLVEIAAQTNALAGGVPANPQGDIEPAATSRRYDPAQSRYEDEAEYAQRLTRDFTAIVNVLRQETGRVPRAMAWPKGERNQEAVSIAASLGMPITLTLDAGSASIGQLAEIPRRPIVDDPWIGDFADLLSVPGTPQPLRAVRVALDSVHDPDKAREERNLEALIARIRRLHISAVFLEAYVEPQGSQRVREVYFPNRVLPMRADLFNHVAWQLRSRANVTVYATLPVLRFDFAGALAPADPRSQQLAADLYEDLAASANFGGLFFDEDAMPRDGGDGLEDLTAQIAARVARFRGPVKTARNLTAPRVALPAAGAEPSQSLAVYVRSYDYAVITKMPDRQGTATPDAGASLAALVAAARLDDSSLRRVVFNLGAAEGPSGRGAGLAREMELLRELGASNFGYYPDDFLRNRPDIDTIHAVMSLQTVPAR